MASRLGLVVHVSREFKSMAASPPGCVASELCASACDAQCDTPALNDELVIYICTYIDT